MLSPAPRDACLKQTLLTRCPATIRFAHPKPYAWTRRSLCWRSTGTALRRNYSAVASPAAAEAAENVTVARRSNGEVTLNIFHPRVREDPASPVILFLPTAPRAAETFGVRDEKIIAALSAASNGTIVRVNYRTGDDARYPTPVHDVLAGYDYAKERFASEPWATRTGRVKKTHLRIGVYGQLVGGSLAAMLGLTESHLAQDRIAAIALNCPVVDWVFPETHQTVADALNGNAADKTNRALEQAVRRRRKRNARLPSWEASGETSALSSKNLKAIRRKLFKKPANYFDPFASPIHFFRSPGSSIPADPTLTIADGDDPLALLSQPPKPRKAHRVFPPSNSTLILPSIRLSIGSHNPLSDSNDEFVKLLRRSVVRTALTRASTQVKLDRFEEEPMPGDGRLEMAVGDAERNVEYHICEGVGLWGTEKEGEWLEEVWRVGRWFREVLG